MSASAAQPRPDPVLARAALVAVGGMAGTALRAALSFALPPVAGVPLTTVVINIVGAFALGVLIALLLGHAAESPARQRLRLGLGTGLLGGFTTYSALAIDTLLLLAEAAWLAVAYALGTVLLGAAASFAGLALGTRLGGGAHHGGSPDDGPDDGGGAVGEHREEATPG